MFVTSLQYGEKKQVRPDQTNILWNSRRGFTIRRPNYYYIGLFYCQALVEGVAHLSYRYFIYRPGEPLTPRALGSTYIKSLTLTFRRFYPKRLTVSTFVRRRRNNNMSLSVQ